MGRRVALLRGINLGPRNRIAMPELRELLSTAGFGGVGTYVQSGNVVLTSAKAPERIEGELERLIAEHFGFDVGVIVRTDDELAEVVERNPLGEVAVDPKRYQVTFLREELDEGRADELAELATESERLVAIGREVYAWHPEGVARSRLWGRLASPGLGVKGTSRNWTTVTTLLDMATGR